MLDKPTDAMMLELARYRVARNIVQSGGGSYLVSGYLRGELDDSQAVQKELATLTPDPVQSDGRTLENLHLVRNSLSDLRKGFARNVDPARWVEQVLARLDAAITRLTSLSAPEEKD